MVCGSVCLSFCGSLPSLVVTRGYTLFRLIRSFFVGMSAPSDHDFLCIGHAIVPAFVPPKKLWSIIHIHVSLGVFCCCVFRQLCFPIHVTFRGFFSRKHCACTRSLIDNTPIVDWCHGHVIGTVTCATAVTRPCVSQFFCNCVCFHPPQWMMCGVCLFLGSRY